jgi:phosphatidylserine/phosphatidylglycerophosphate/cardiolipin synthase-like enzyme
LIDVLDHLVAGSRVDIYLILITDKKTIGSIVRAAGRGVATRLLTDSYELVYGNDISFTHGVAFRNFRKAIKDGAALQVRTVLPDPRISEIHRKFALVAGRREDGRVEDFLLTGSANLSSHSADGSQLELDVLFESGAVKGTAHEWFDAAWANRIEGEKNQVPRLIREPWRLKDVTMTTATWLLSLLGLGG